MPTRRKRKRCSSRDGLWWAYCRKPDCAYDPYPPCAVYQSCASWPLMIMTVIVMIVGIALPFSPLASYLRALPLSYFPWLVAILAGYMTLTQLVKGFYSRRYGWQ